ncbi:MAG TPA: SigE family RNA polymerase sigma factor [Actinomycetes bacterium]|nr:SigE family RNA polymerase sigma factor [Actinomycetes bacterium]
MDDFDAFVRQHGNEFARLAFLLAGDRGHAEDLVQGVLLNVHKKWARISEIERPVAYVRTMIAREHISWRRRHYTAEVVTDAHVILSVDRTASDHADTIARRDATWERLSALSKRQRAVIVLRYYLDLTDDEIAQVLDCSKATVRSHATRALRSLRESSDTLSEETLT